MKTQIKKEFRLNRLDFNRVELFHIVTVIVETMLFYGKVTTLNELSDKGVVCMTDCIFCKIIDGEIPSAKVYEDDEVFAFLDLSQTTPGHTLLVPKQHLTDIFEFDEEAAMSLFARVPKLARAIQQAFPESKGLNIVNNNRELAYQSVFHSHVHLIPRYQAEEGFAMKFENNQASYSQEEFSDRAASIVAVLSEAE